MGKIRLIGMAMVLVFLSTSCVGKIRDLEDELSRAELEYVELEKDYADLLKVNQKLGGEGAGGGQEEVQATSSDNLKTSRRFEDVAVYYAEVPNNVFTYGFIADVYAADHMTDEDLLFFDLLGPDGYRRMTFSSEKLMESITFKVANGKVYLGSAEKDSDEVYLFYNEDGQGFADVYRMGVNLETDSDISWEFARKIVLDFEIEKVHKTLNTLIFETINVEREREWVLCDRDLEIIEKLVVPEGMMFGQVRYDVHEEILRYFWQVTVDDEIRYYAVDVDYSIYGGSHCISVPGESILYVNGMRMANIYVPIFDVVKGKVLHQNYVFDTSNSGLVTRVRSLKRDMPVGAIRDYMDHQTKDLFYFTSGISGVNQKGIIYMEKGDRLIAAEHPIFEASIKDNIIKYDADYYYYIENESLDLVRLDQNLNEMTRFDFNQDKFTKKVSLNLSKDISWGIVDNRLVWVEGKYITWIDLKSGEINTKKTEFEYWIFRNNGLYNSDSRSYRFDFDALGPRAVYEFVVSASFGDFGYYLYEGIMYYGDDTRVTEGPSERLTEREDILPVSQAPEILYKGESMSLMDTSELEGSSYVQLFGSRWIGLVEEGAFIPLIDKPVRSVHWQGDKFVYLGYDDLDHKIFYYDGIKEYQVEVDEAVDSAALMGDQIFYVTGGEDLYSLSIDQVVHGEGLGVYRAAIDEMEEKRRYTYSSAPNYQLSSNGKYLIIYDFYKTLVYDKELNLIDACEGRFVGLTKDDQLLVNVYYYTIRRDLAGGGDYILDLGGHTYYKLLSDDAMISHTYDYGPGMTDIINIYEELEDIRGMKTLNDSGGQGYDYSIEVGRSYTSYIMIYDHIEKRLDVVYWIDIDDYELREDGFYYWDAYDLDENFYPLRPDSKVRIYEEDRF